MNSPILLIGFNRPDTLKQVFNQVRIAEPKKLYFSVDGPRKGNDKDKEASDKVRNIIKEVDWPCEIHTLFREENVGCGRGPAEAITWAFENEDRLIVLEDDCVPSLSFFSFCDEMLEMYKDDERVNIISGRSHQHGSAFFKNQDYLFSHFAHTWGWATWKRVWDKYDIRMSDFPQWLENGGCVNIFPAKNIGEYYNNKLEATFNHIDEEITHSWDSQWVYTRFKTGGLGIVPSRNLIHNIGCNGTHTGTIDPLPLEDMPSQIRHPQFVIPNYNYEIYHFNHQIFANKKFIFRIVRRIMKFFKN